jgi:P27 family predicted phage terminase small subunit
MMKTKQTKTNRPPTPEQLDGEALLEWGRICDDLDATGNLATADRALLLLYCQVWAANHDVAKHVAKHGPICRLENKTVCQSPHFKTMAQTAAQLAKMLEQMGLTPASRRMKTDAEPAPLDLD